MDEVDVVSEKIVMAGIAHPEPVGLMQCDTCIRHYQFEIFIRQNLLPSTHYDLVLKKDVELAGENDYNEGLKEPHFKLKSRGSGHVFYADARYIPRISSRMIEWCEPYAFERYQELNSRFPVFILIGEGRQPAAPQDVFLFPVKNARNNRMLRSHIGKYRISPSAGINEEFLLSSRLSY